ncbi:hypothetical protein LOTGIDRAFT_122683 [Lottia gigantea]|uniref:Hydantoinase/oxoprolinase N-terminal domain-containing protein n=1 Tax=Lottia gigantea TaxID=225164 RepID=V3ZHY6_LOTGI|nr:hypothetical protein LOTGIDRAFT_122683 [Lottia gigantea]ESO90858.1 hypothetical protein LOTGIDRAFT_122683 [Lottia gigantea]
MANVITPVVIGVDVGGTNTDAVLIAGNKQQATVLSTTKQSTSSDVTTGVHKAIYTVLKQTHENGQKVSVVQVNIGTTHFVNAAVQGKDLVKVAVIRLCGTVSQDLPPFSDFPEFLKRTINGSVHLVKGGFRYDGRPIDEIDENEIRQVIATLKVKGLKYLVISGVFSPVRQNQERRVKELIDLEYPEASVTLSCEIGQIGLLERENAAILNECLKPLCQKTIDGFKKALSELGLDCPLFLTQNDGTIISAEDALEHPIYTFASGPTNSMRGAAYLSQIKDALVVDIGGTTTDVGMLKNGFPREASTQVKVGGLKTNFRMPNVLSIGLGGGSYVISHLKDGSRFVTVGPLSAGYNLINEARVFTKSAEVLTSSDVAVAGGLAILGDVSAVADLDKEIVRLALDKIHEMVENTIDKMKFDEEDLPVILVGGGSILIDPNRKLKGTSEVILPKHFGIANALGAALCQVSNPAKESVRTLFFAEATEAIYQACNKAIEKTVLLGASRSSTVIYEKDYSTLAYIHGQVIQVKIKAIGDMENWNKPGLHLTAWSSDNLEAVPEPKIADARSKQTTTASGNTLTEDDKVFENALHPTDPYIDPGTGEWILNAWDIECIVLGAGIFGCGGGGSPYLGRLRCLSALKRGKKLRVITPERLIKNTNAERDRVVCVAFMGAPLIMIEQLMSSDYHPPKKGVNKKEKKVNIVALISAEIGGCNAVEPLLVSAAMGIPTVDADGMGRAFPELQMFCPFYNGAEPYPAVLAHDKDRRAVMLKTPSAKQLEHHFRDTVVDMGCSGGLVLAPMKTSDVMKKTVLHSVSRAWRMGNAVLRARLEKMSPINAILKEESAHHLITGKVRDVQRETTAGFNKGRLTIEGSDNFCGNYVKIEFQNENLVVLPLDKDGESVCGEALACVPDLIMLIDADTAEPITTEEMKYGLRVSLVVLASHAMLRTKEALRFVGPQAFRYPESVANFKPFADAKITKPIPPIA